ncbi:hypothetical protein MKX03_009471 [Papaver bracteatum]|nr:hypothetical protein MKX03_009471 [Papaver bracteatum]
MDVNLHTPTTCVQSQSFQGPSFDLHFMSPAAPVQAPQVTEQQKADEKSELPKTREQQVEEKEKSVVDSIIRRVNKDPRERKRNKLEDGFTGTSIPKKKNRKQKDSQIIDLDAIEYIDPTPPKKKPLKEAKSLEL